MKIRRKRRPAKKDVIAHLRLLKPMIEAALPVAHHVTPVDLENARLVIGYQPRVRRMWFLGSDDGRVFEHLFDTASALLAYPEIYRQLVELEEAWAPPRPGEDHYDTTMAGIAFLSALQDVEDEYHDLDWFLARLEHYLAATVERARPILEADIETTFQELLPLAPTDAVAFEKLRQILGSQPLQDIGVWLQHPAEWAIWVETHSENVLT